MERENNFKFFFILYGFAFGLTFLAILTQPPLKSSYKKEVIDTVHTILGHDTLYIKRSYAKY